jgi:amidase
LVARIGQDPFGAGGELEHERSNPVLVQSLADPSKLPDLHEFRELRTRYINLFNAVMDKQGLDALIFPQSLDEAPMLHSDDCFIGTAFSEINIGGMPAVIVPAGHYPSGTPFGIIIVGRLWDEARLLRLAYAFEQATHFHQVPSLVPRPQELAPAGLR